jgi:hypothetical protein
MMSDLKQHIRLGLIVEDQYCQAYREFVQKVWPERVRGYPLAKKKSIPADRKLRVWIQECQNTFDFVFVLVDLDTPVHHKDPQYFQNLKQICNEAGAALLIVKRELESWVLADVTSIVRWKLGNEAIFPLNVYQNTAQDPWEPKNEILRLVKQLARHRGQREPKAFDPEWIAEIAKRVELNEVTLSRNCSLRCLHDLIKGCCGDNGLQYFEAYPHQKHCDQVDIPEE